MTQKVLSYDLGGTKIAVAVVTDQGRVEEEIRVPVVFQEGKAAVLRQLTELGQSFLARHQRIKKVGIASAGPLDPQNGVLLDPTNFGNKKGTWGKVPIVKILRESLGRKVYLENDAAAAALAEHWIGRAKKTQNAVVMTLGTGLGTGIICNGQLVRAGQGLHTEGGHLIVKCNDRTAPCGCGNYGCAEAYLSGRNFERRASKKISTSTQTPSLKGHEIAALAKTKNRKALQAFEEYSEVLAFTMHNYVRLFCPEMLVLTGSFAAASNLFLPLAKERLKILLAREIQTLHPMPKIVTSMLRNQAGIIGAAFIALKGR